MDKIKAFFSTVTGAQWFIIFIVSALVTATNKYLPPGDLHDGILMILGSFGVQGMVSTRKPSMQGGTTLTADLQKQALPPPALK